MKSIFYLLPLVPLTLSAADHKAYTDPSSTDKDFTIQGEYSGELNGKKTGIQIIAKGDGKFEAVGYPGGLPGDGWNGHKDKLMHASGSREEGATTVVFKGDDLKGEVDGVKFFLKRDKRGKQVEMPRVDRKSPTLGAKPPEGAVVLFGEGKNDFTGSSVTEDGLLTEGATSTEKFNDFTLHIEFRLPYMPDASGQDRGNSGLYLQGRYEVQMLDSFGLEGKDNECGGIYQISEPDQNMCFSPLTWQTYDVEFQAAKFDRDGNKKKNAEVTIKQNGVIIHKDLELPAVTGGAMSPESAEPGPIHLQNHGNPVRYRNIWVVKG